nr:MAM and LDL-receptor class A domain-containing protein 1-like [Lytechinus pictus]
MGTDLGMFAFVSTAKPPRSSGEVAQLFSPIYPATLSECLTFWFHIYGSAIGKLEVLVYDTVSLQSAVVWMENGHDEMEWHYGRASLSANHPYQIAIKATLYDGVTGDIAIDDLTILDESCSRPGFCDFEKGRCGWSDEKELDSRDWLRNNGATPSPYTGPSFDHTTGTDKGMYMYFEADNDLDSSYADLVSEYLPRTQGSCMTFWYHMFGNDIGSLEVFVMGSDGNRNNPVWSQTGTQGDVWIQGSADIVYIGEFKIVFRASGSKSAKGDIAIDDIDVHTRSCDDGGGPTTLPVISMSCTFESNLCSYTQLRSDQFDWTRTFWSSSTDSTGPRFDHTQGDASGRYVYTDATGRIRGDKAQLASPAQNPTGPGSSKCLVFWYHMYGVHVDRFNVYLRSSGPQMTVDDLIFTKYGTQGNQWKKAEKEITSDDTWMSLSL